MPCLVRQKNRSLQNLPQQADLCSVSDARVIVSSPVSLFGLHWLWLGRPLWFLIYLFTFGLGGIGWIRDMFRLERLQHRARTPGAWDAIYLDDAYALAFPFGFLGLHRFYLGDWKWGLVLLLTVGGLGVGWLHDLIMLPALVAAAKQRRELETANEDTVYSLESGTQHPS